ncbi:MAG: hypothetical protein LBG90_01360 [Spirochaetaceae bacterium]|jgi:uncharacterized membrane protein YczE|nr:hypothetical protein [Spirochaetaceae bacterium]
MPFFKKSKPKETLSRILLCSLGVFCIGLGVGALRYADFGLDPFMSLIQGLYLRVFRALGFGTGYLIFCGILLVLILLFDPSKIGFGTILSMILTGYVSEGLFFFLGFLPEENFFLRAGGMLLGLLGLCAGSGLYLNAGLGTSPYDAAGLVITEKLRDPRRYRWVRIGTDAFCVAAGFLLGSKPGAGTIFMAFFTGPLFAFFRSRFAAWGRARGIITWD